MKILATIAAVLMVTATNAAVGRGPCPSGFNNIDWNANLASQYFYLKYVDNLVNDGWTLYNLIVQH